jgi:hypothetical protein
MAFMELNPEVLRSLWLLASMTGEEEAIPLLNYTLAFTL